MKEPAWLAVEDALAIHQMLLAEFGGEDGVRDSGLLDSALARPKWLWKHEKVSLFRLAAAYASGIVRNHPFLGGNKRVAFVLAAVFLEINGVELRAEEVRVVEMTLGLAARAVTEPAYAAWLERASRG